MFSTVVLAVGLLFAENSLQASVPSFSDVLASSKNNLSSFSDVLKKQYPDLLTRISSQSSDTPITVLAPSNAAFAKTIYYPIIGPAFSDNDIGTIRAILDYHVVEGNHTSSDLLPTFQYLPTWLSNSSYTNVTGGQRVGGVMQSGKDMFWVSGQSNRSPGIITDIAFSGGTVHVIDSLLVPPTSFPLTAEIFDNASEPNELTSFLGAIYYHPVNGTISSLAALLNTSSDITIFAPNNVALETVSSSLTSLSQSDLTNLLQYHTIPGPAPWYSTNFSTTNSTTITTLAGQPLTISFSSNSLFVNSARLLTSDLLIENGVMHVLDNVLSPDQAGTPNPSLATQVPVLSTGGDFNISQAPFTTFLPNSIQTPTVTKTANHGFGGSTTSVTTTVAGAAATSKAGAGRTEVGFMGCVAGVFGMMAIV